jgi:hypothetical protein
MENLVYVKASLWIVLAIAILLAIALVVYELRKAGGGVSGALKLVKDYLFPPDPVMPPQLQEFVNEAVNQPNGYVPWSPTVEPDESYPPAWLKKGAL